MRTRLGPSTRRAIKWAGVIGGLMLLVSFVGMLGFGNGKTYDVRFRSGSLELRWLTQPTSLYWDFIKGPRWKRNKRLSDFLPFVRPYYSLRGPFAVRVIPIWWLYVPVAIAAIVSWRRNRLRHWPECGNCGYNLTGNVSGICPECGTAIKDAPFVPGATK